MLDISKYEIEDVIDNLKYTVLKKSKIHGIGLFSNAKIKKGTMLGFLEGQVVPWEQHIKYHNELEWNALDEETVMVRPYRTKYGFINHSRTPNCILKYFPLRVETLEDIDVNVELTLDYRKEKTPREYKSKENKDFL